MATYPWKFSWRSCVVARMVQFSLYAVLHHGFLGWPCLCACVFVACGLSWCCLCNDRYAMALGGEWVRGCGGCLGLISGWFGVSLRVDVQWFVRSEEHTSELQSRFDIVCRLL